MSRLKIVFQVTYYKTVALQNPLECFLGSIVDFFYVAMILQVVGAGHRLQGPCHGAHRWERAAFCHELRTRLMILITVPEMYRAECSQMLQIAPN